MNELEYIVTHVCEELKVPKLVIFSSNHRNKDVTFAKWVSIEMARNFNVASTKDIKNYFSYSNETRFIYTIKHKIKEHLVLHPEKERIYASIKSHLGVRFSHKKKRSAIHNIYLNEIDIANIVLLHFPNINLQDLRYRKGKKREICFPRQLCHYFGVLYNVNNTIEIGNYFGGKSHSTVSYSCGIMQKRRSLKVKNKDKDLMEEIDADIRKLISNRKFTQREENNYYGSFDEEISPISLYHQKP